MKTPQPIVMNPFGHLPSTVFWLSALILLTAITISTPMGAMFTLALFGASMQLAAMWAVLGPAGYLRNSFWSLLGSFAIGIAAIVGCYIGTNATITFLDSFKLMSFGPMIWCVAQLPYWGLRLFLNWQIRFDEDTEPAKISIKDIMAYTVFIALSLALLQFGHSRGVNFTGVQPDVIVHQFLVPISLISIITFLLVCLPAIRLLLSPRYCQNSLRIYMGIQVAVAAAMFYLMILMDSRSALLFVTTVIGFSSCISILIGVHRCNGLFLSGLTRGSGRAN